MVNNSSCTAELWMHSGDSGLLSLQQLEELRTVYWRHQRTQWENEGRSRYWIWLGEFSSYVIMNIWVLILNFHGSIIIIIIIIIIITCHKIRRSVGIIAKMRYYIPRYLLLNLYHALITTYLNYVICSWGNCPQTYFNKCLVLPKRALRLIYFAKNQRPCNSFF